MGLHCSHFHGRGKWATRFDPDNAEALCYGCHSYMGAHPHLHRERIEDKLGRQLYDNVQERANDTKLGRLAKRSEKEIRAHYRAELRRLEQGADDLENWI